MLRQIDFLLKILLDGFKLSTFVETSYLNVVYGFDTWYFQNVLLRLDQSNKLCAQGNVSSSKG